MASNLAKHPLGLKVGVSLCKHPKFSAPIFCVVLYYLFIFVFFLAFTSGFPISIKATMVPPNEVTKDLVLVFGNYNH